MERKGDNFYFITLDNPGMAVTYHHANRPMHSHYCIEMVYVTGGSANHLLQLSDGTETAYPLTAGDYFFVDYHTRHGYSHGTKDFTVINFLFRPDLIEKLTNQELSLDAILAARPFLLRPDDLKGPLANLPFHDTDRTVGPLFEKALAAYQSQTYGYTELLRCYAIEIILLTATPMLQRPTQRKHGIITQIQEFVALHYAEHITLTKICQDMFYSLQYISKKFKEVTGVSFERYLQETRIRNACCLLTETDNPIDAIADMVGYKDPSSFRGVFQKQTGLTPLHYRKKYSRNANNHPEQ